MTNPPQRITLVWTGASGAKYGLRLLEELLKSGQSVWLAYSKAAQIVMKLEAGLDLPSHSGQAQAFLQETYQVDEHQLQVFSRSQWTAPIASGTNPANAMVICPCTTGRLAKIANGICHDLIDRAADVMLKEKRKLILVLRETPLSLIHIENMKSLTKAGALILPANPGFYFNPTSVEQIIDFVVARVLDQLGISHQLIHKWGETPNDD